ncbi:YdcF family protein [Nicoliella lavandulae]|uniref:YdcF family protein n=1 Tax=Nicoliella lavandulae TaxID=3082954 RepID=A0ABU8SMI9_9LACO
MATIALGSFFLMITVGIIGLNNHLIIDGYVVLFGLIILLLLFIYFFQGFFWLWNALIVWRRENHTLANMLTLIIGVITLGLPVLNGMLTKHPLGPIGVFSYSVIVLSILYLLFCIVSFMLAAFLFTFKKPRPNKRFIIVLGAGLLHGDQVSPLLASRINKGIEFYHQVKAATGHAPLLICSGGQGNDETIPEGQAMRTYAIDHGVAANHVVAEVQSKTTLQNMLFSKRIIEQHKLPLNDGIYVSNDYHIFRAGIYAHQAGLPIQGLGARTSRFFIPNATIREYVALLMNHKRFHMMMVGLILLASLGVALLVGFIR